MIGGTPLSGSPIGAYRAPASGMVSGIASTLAMGQPKGRIKSKILAGIASTLVMGTPMARRVRFMYAIGIPSTLALGAVKVITWQELPPDSAAWVTAWNRIPTDG